MVSDLKSQLILLKSLQDIDVSLHKIERELNEIPIKVDEAFADYKAAKDAMNRLEAEKAAVEKRRRGEEQDVEAENLRIKEREAKLYAIKTNKEYQAAIKEIADAKQANKEHEDATLMLMEKIDAISQEITQLSSGLADKESAFKEKEKELRQNEGSLVTERDGLAAKSREAEKGVEPGVLKQYRFVQNKFSDALALSASGICSGCNKRIPPQVYIELQKWKEVVSCPNCHRILFFEEAVAVEK